MTTGEADSTDMPTYEYRCPEGHEFEVFQRMSDEPGAQCPTCGAQSERLISAGAGLLFKGSGFYITDYRSPDYAEKAKAEKPNAEKSKSEKPKSEKPKADTDSSKGSSSEPSGSAGSGSSPGGSASGGASGTSGKGND